MDRYVDRQTDIGVRYIYTYICIYCTSILQICAAHMYVGCVCMYMCVYVYVCVCMCVCVCVCVCGWAKILLTEDRSKGLRAGRTLASFFSRNPHHLPCEGMERGG
jgi:hypothetical protein